MFTRYNTVDEADAKRALNNIEKMKQGKSVNFQEKFHKPGPKITLSELYRNWFAKAHPDHPAVKAGTFHAFKAKIKKLFSRTGETPKPQKPAWDETKIVKSTSEEIRDVGIVSKGIKSTEESTPKVVAKAAGKAVSKAAGPVAGGIEAWETWKDVERISNEDIPKKEKEYKYTRSVTKHATGFAVAWGGATVGAKYGAIIGASIGGSIGTLPLPGAGTLTGGVIGGIAGSIIGGAIGGITAGVAWDRGYEAVVPQKMP